MKKTLLGSLIVAAAAAPVSGLLHAQANVTALEEIIVTARRRAETAQSVPLAVTALTGNILDRNNIVNVEDLRTQSPSLTIVPGAGANRATPTFAIRGLSQQELTIFSDPSVVMYYNEIAIPRTQGMNQALFDVQAVEVLKGPQGTLFGRNVTGGAIHIRPNMPGKEFEASVGATVGNYGTIDTDFMVNAPLAERVQVRVAGSTTKSDGWFKDVILDDEINEEDTKSVRASIALQPTDGVDSVFSYSRFIEDAGGTGSYVGFVAPNHPAHGRYTGAIDPDLLFAQQQARDYDETASGVDQFSRVSTWDLTNTTTIELSDELSVKNIVGYRDVSSRNNDDVDGLPVPLIQIYRVDDVHQFSEEFQLIGTTDTLEWIAGLYYFREEGENNGYSITVQPQAPYPQGTPLDFAAWSTTNPIGQNTSYAAFAQANQSLDSWMEGLSVTVGLRYNVDKREATLENRTQSACRVGDANGVPFPLSQCSFSDEETFKEPTWNIGLEYQLTDDALLYLAHRHGYRTGVFSPRASTPQGFSTTADPEIVDDIEFGGKADWLLSNGMSLRTNFALYYAQYEDIQRLLTDSTTIPVTTVAANAGDAAIKGAELEFTFLPTANLELSGFASYTDAEFKEFADPFTGADLSGNPFARAPEWIYSLTARYTLPLDPALGDISLQANYWFHDEYSANDNFTPNAAMDSFDLINARISWAGVFGTPLDLALWVKNAADEEYEFQTLALETALGFASFTRGDPRTFGFDVKYSFGAAAQ